MSQQSSSTIEWQICENPLSTSIIDRQAVQMGPFATEEECRTMLTRLQQMPFFSASSLEIHKRYRRREKRVRIKLPIQIRRVETSGTAWDAQTIDISSLGARLGGFRETVNLGEFLQIRCGQREAVFRVAWLGSPNTPTAGQVGVECFTPETNIWDFDFSVRTDDEPLLQQLAVARAVQGRLFPSEKPALRSLDYSGKCVQALTVGGDYYDFLNLRPGKVGFVLADVAGKGVPAALLMANLQGSIHNRAEIDCRDLPALLSGVNDHLFRHTEAHRYATLFFGCYDDDARKLSYVNCGHSAPLLLRRDGEVERLAPTATVLGLLERWEGTAIETQVGSGDLLTIYTDGITETTSSNGEEFGEERLLRVLQQSKALPAKDVVLHVEQAVEDFRSTGHLQDDLTLVVGRAK